MKYYAQINSIDVLIGFDIETSSMIADEYGSTDIKNIEVSEEVYNNAKQYGANYYIYQNKEIILNPEYNSIKLNEAKEEKYKEANVKATEYLEGGNALYEVEEGKHIEATTNNISKIGLKVAKLVLKQDFETLFPWNTKEDINIYLNAITGEEVTEGLEAIQNEVWTVKFPNYVAQIDEAETIEEVEAIIINYSKED